MNDIEPRVPLEALDPGREDPGYWARIHGQIMEAVAPQLATRGLSRPTVGDALLSWSRLVVPLGAAAVVGALMLTQPVPADDLSDIAGLEERLHQPADGEAPLPSFLHGEREVDRDMILLAMEEF